jgi:hypothetical protein
MARSKATSNTPQTKTQKPKLKDILTKLTPLALIANVAAALVALGIDIPILDVKLEGEDLLITLYGGRIEKFPLDYNLVLKIDKLDEKQIEKVNLAATVLGKDKHSPADWQPDVESFKK